MGAGVGVGERHQADGVFSITIAWQDHQVGGSNPTDAPAPPCPGSIKEAKAAQPVLHPLHGQCAVVGRALDVHRAALRARE